MSVPLVNQPLPVRGGGLWIVVTGGIENKNHYVRDMTWQEDQHQAWVGNGLHIMATLRNLTLGILRLNGIQKIKEATEG